MSMTSEYSSDMIASSPKISRSKLGKTPTRGDRFIPTRSAMDIDISNYHLTKENVDPAQTEYNERLAEALFNGKMDSKVLAFKSKAPTAPQGHLNANRVLFSSNVSAAKKTAQRQISDKPIKVLDAPNFSDDYYLNVLDWSSQNVVAVGLTDTVYVFDASTGGANALMTCQDNSISSVSWTRDGNHLAIGMDNGTVELWDAENQQRLNVLRGHERRVGSLAWNGAVLSTGSRSGAIHNHDVRLRQSLTSVFQGHSQEVCGLKWSTDGSFLASGGNDNLVNIWSMAESTPKFTFSDHTAAVKGLAWCPWQRDLLATGGGAADRTIKFWNTTTGACVNSIDTGSQVSQLAWSKTPGCKEIVSSHGYAKNQLAVWKYPSLAQTAELTGHCMRVLCMAQSPDGTKMVTGAADETLCFWDVFPDSTPVVKSITSVTKPSRSVSVNTMRIR